MARIASIKKIGTKTGTPVSSVSGVALGSGPSAGNTSTAANNNTGSIKQIGTGVATTSGVHAVSPASDTSSSSNYKLSIASLLLAMKNQALGSLSLGGSKSGGSITENYSGVNLG